MPTIIDELFVSLGLDPSKFTKGQKETTKGLREIEGASQKAGEAVDRAQGRIVKASDQGARAAVGAADRTAKATAKSTQGFSRQASQVERFAKKLAYHSRQAHSFWTPLIEGALEFAGVLAGIRGMEDLGKTVGEGAAIRRISKIIGQPTSYVSALSNAAYQFAGGSQSATVDSLAKFTQAVWHYHMNGTGPAGEWMAILKRMGINPADIDNVQKLMPALAHKMHHMAPAKAMAIGSKFGFDMGTINLLMQGRKALMAHMAAVRVEGVWTDKAAKSMEKLQTALRGVELASATLARELMTGVAPTLIKVAGMIEDLEEGKPGAALKLGREALKLSKRNILPGKPPLVIRDANKAGRFVRSLIVGHGDLGAPLPPHVKAQVEAEARKYGLNAAHMVKLARAEGGTGKISSAGAIGTMQLMPGTAAMEGVNPYSQRQNVKGGMEYYASLLKRFRGNYAAADAAYNAGPGAVGVAYFARTGDPSRLPKQTQQYVSKINGEILYPPRLALTHPAMRGLPPSVTAAVSHLRAVQHHSITTNTTHIGHVTVNAHNADAKGVKRVLTGPAAVSGMLANTGLS